MKAKYKLIFLFAQAVLCLIPSMALALSLPGPIDYSRTEDVYIDIFYKTTYEEDPNLWVRKEKTAVTGRIGLKKITYEISFAGPGSSLERKIIAEEIIREPIDEVILRGTKERKISINALYGYLLCGAGVGLAILFFAMGRRSSQRRGEKENPKSIVLNTYEEYFLSRFPQQLRSFLKTVPSRLLFFPGFFPDDGKAFRFRHLIKSEGTDSLKDVPEKDEVLFLISLAYTILIDQVVYTHFNDAYERFSKKNNTPKMKIGWMNANPWEVFHTNVLRSRHIDREKFYSHFNNFTDFFVDYMSTYVGVVNDHALANAMLNDRDVTRGPFGAILRESIKKWDDFQNQEWMGHIMEQADEARRTGRRWL